MRIITRSFKRMKISLCLWLTALAPVSAFRISSWLCAASPTPSRLKSQTVNPLNESSESHKKRSLPAGVVDFVSWRQRKMSSPTSKTCELKRDRW